MEASISNSANPEYESVLSRIRAVDSALADCDAHQLMMLVIWKICFSLGLVYCIRAMDIMLGPLLAEQPWGELLRMILMIGAMSIAMVAFLFLCIWLLSLPVVNLLLAVMWVSADVLLLVTLPFLIADLQGEPFRQWTARKQLIFPIGCWVLQCLLLKALLNLGKSIRGSIDTLDASDSN